MVRRVGFGEDEKPEKPHKRHVGRHKRVFGIMPEVEAAENTARSDMRRKRRRKPRLSNRFQNPLIPRDNSRRGKARAKWIIVVFLLVWLSVWSFGIYSSVEAYQRSSGGDALFLMVWIGGASVGWLLAVLLLLALLFGKETANKKPAGKS